jgi:hypothetical protein
MAFRRYFGGKTRSRSGFEEKIKKDLEGRGIAFEYEKHTLSYVKRHCPHCLKVVDTGTYTPDFVIQRVAGVRLVVEGKGHFDSEDRTKMLLVKKNNPLCDLRMLFQRDQPIRKGSKTLYSTWAAKHGFPYAIGISIPEGWLK